MAPKLSRIERKELENIIISKYMGNETIKDEEIAKIYHCSTRSVCNARSNILRHGMIDCPAKPFGRPAEVTENMWLALWYKLRKRPGLSQRALADCLYKQYGVRRPRPPCPSMAPPCQARSREWAVIMNAAVLHPKFCFQNVVREAIQKFEPQKIDWSK